MSLPLLMVNLHIKTLVIFMVPLISQLPMPPELLAFLALGMVSSFLKWISIYAAK
jgi:hypothetical protein